MNKRLQSLDFKISRRLMNHFDCRVDRRVCGRSLVKYVPSIDRDDENGVGGTGSQSTPYFVLKRLFKTISLTPEDVLLDVGCGKGRVLAYLVREKAPCRLCGIEHNAEVGRIAADWAGRYEQVRIIIGDALTLDYEPYTVLTLARSFLPKTFLAFTEQLERTVKHPITLLYWYDQQSGHLLKGRPGWSLQKRAIINRVYGLKAARVPQGYSIWTYDPEKRETS